jgi:hypothetical protein
VTPDEQLDQLCDEAGPALGVLQAWLARGEVGNVTSADARAEPGFVRLRFDSGECLDFACGAADPTLAEAVALSIAAAAGRLAVRRH